MAGPFI